MNAERPGHRAYSRDEPVARRLDRNYGELLQELRVAQNGVQILFAFLLTIPFQVGFMKLSGSEHVIYVITLLCAAVSVVLFVAPVATHRLLFRRGLKDTLVRVTARLTVAAITFLALSILGAVGLVTDVVAGPGVAVGITAALAVLIGVMWLAVPEWVRRNLDEAGVETDPLPAPPTVE
jgi:hypothetical protein